MPEWRSVAWQVDLGWRKPCENHQDKSVLELLRVDEFSQKENTELGKVTNPEVLIYRSRVGHRARRGSKSSRKQEEPRWAGAGECPERARRRVVLKGVSTVTNAAKKTNKRCSRNSPLDLATRCCLWYWQQFRGEMKIKARCQWT